MQEFLAAKFINIEIHGINLMYPIIKSTWALLLGIFLLMIGYGVQGPLLAIRGKFEGFGVDTMSWIMSGYFLGLLLGSQITVKLIDQVGHVRVFAALASLISASLLLFAITPNPFAWFALRIIIGFCFSGVFIVSESWLNDGAPNRYRAQTISIYLIVQLFGMLGAQILINFGETSGYFLFALVSVIVSLSFAPILLTVNSAPIYKTAKRLSVIELYHISPFGCISMIFFGGISSLIFSMTPVFFTELNYSTYQITLAMGLALISSMALQLPISWVSDTLDRRSLIVFSTLIGAFIIGIGFLCPDTFVVKLLLVSIVCAIAMPLYPTIIAYTNDYLNHEDMAAASGGLIFLASLGSCIMPVVCGYLIKNFGPNMFFILLMLLFLMISIYGFYRMAVRSTSEQLNTTSHVTLNTVISPVGVEIAQEEALKSK